MNRKTILLIIGVILSLCVVTTFCGISYQVVSRILAGDATTTTATATPNMAGQDLGAGTLRLPGGLPPTLDPALVQDSTSAEYVVHLYSGLVRLDGALEVVPDLAERWEISTDGRTFTFYLRRDAQFADGTAIDANDLVYALERACSPALASPVAGAYLADIVGVPEMLQGQASTISGLTMVDDYTLQIQIDEPKAYFLAKLTYPTAYVVDRARVEQGGDQWWQEPNGSGPYVLDSISTDGIVLVRNDRYYGPAPQVARVEFDTGSGLPITMYENDQLDITYVAPDELARVTDPYNALSKEYQIQSELSVQYLAFNLHQPPFDDPLVRQAFAQAIDRQKLAELVLQGTAVAAKGILPPEMPGYDPAWPGLVYDPQAARQALAQSSYGEAAALPEIVLTVSGAGGFMDATTTALVAMLEENLGIVVQVEQVDWAFFLRDLNQQRYQLYSSGWIADYPDAQNFLDVLFHSASSQNHSGYANAEVDKLLEQARVEQDEARRMALYQQAERQIITDVPWVPLTHGLSYVLVKPYVHGYQASAGLYPWLLDVRLTESAR